MTNSLQASVEDYNKMICKRLMLNFKKDAKYWGLFLLSLILIVFLSYIEGKAIKDAVASVWFLLMFMILTVVISDIMFFIFTREKIGFNWLIFVIAFAILSITYNHLFNLSANMLLGLAMAAVGISGVLVALIIWESRGS